MSKPKKVKFLNDEIKSNENRREQASLIYAMPFTIRLIYLMIWKELFQNFAGLYSMTQRKYVV